MKREEVASILNGCEYGNELASMDSTVPLKASGLIVIYGASDDLMESEGFDRQEFDCFGGGTFKIDNKGWVLKPDETLYGNEDSEFNEPEVEKEWLEFLQRKETAKKLEAVWGEEGFAWLFRTDIPHSTFIVMEDGEKYCRGVVIDVMEDWDE